ncbi:MAG TPA: DEDD exonuclease domain-containing protein [Actinomycetota bacterium]|nr:DEDD exonuclease domain-containing protein [Actinomycetota bacterium]
MQQVGVQAGLEEGIPLSRVTFAVVDLETTGGSPRDSAITEVGAVKYRGGQRLGAFHALVHPGRPIPPFITHLTGIDDRTVSDAPPLEWVLPALLGFLEGCVFVAHNARFDFGFLNAELLRLGYEPLPPPPVCTARLARRVVWPDVPNVRLETLARYFRTTARPAHRALPDAEACAEVLHGLLDLGGRLGILTLGDLHQAVRARGRPHFHKIRLTDHLPRAAGVYVFRGRDGRVLYVGKSRDLRARAKRYFYGDDRKKVEDLLAQTARVEGLPCRSELEALALEARLIRRHEPTFNRRGRTWRRHAYLRLDPGEAYPRLKVVREVRGAGAVLGPFSSAAQARLAKEALEEVFPIRRCTRAMGRRSRSSPCALADLGRCLAPCDGRIDPERYGELVRIVITSLSSPGGLLEALEARMGALARAERFEEAALARDRLRALAEALARDRQDRWLIGAGELLLRDPEGHRVRLVRGAPVREGEPVEPIELPCPRDRAMELAAVRGYLARGRVTVERADLPPAEPVAGGLALHRILSRLRAAERSSDPGR